MKQKIFLNNLCSGTQWIIMSSLTVCSWLVSLYNCIHFAYSFIRDFKGFTWQAFIVLLYGLFQLLDHSFFPFVHFSSI